MHIPEAYRINDSNKAAEFMEQNSFGDLVTCNNGLLCSNKVPFFLDRDKNTLYGHFGRANPQLTDIEESNEALVIFSGPHAYVSPQWYVSQNMVPTWNFQTLQVRGTAKTVGADQLIAILRQLTEFHESRFATQWSMNQLEPKELERMLDLIVGFEIMIEDIMFKDKMSQNRSIEDRRSVSTALGRQNNQTARAVATLINDNIDTHQINRGTT